MAESLSLGHWIYGVVPSVGYGIRGQSKGANLDLLGGVLTERYLPVRRSIIEQSEGDADVLMINVGPDQRELLLSIISRGPPDEFKRPTVACHTAVVPLAQLRGGLPTGALRSTMEAIRSFDTRKPGATGNLPDLKVPSRPGAPTDPAPGADLAKARTMSRASALTLASYLLSGPNHRAALTFPESDPAHRREILLAMVELLNLRCQIPIVPSLSDCPSAAKQDLFRLVVAQRSTLGDPSWRHLDRHLDKENWARVVGQEAVYQTIESVYLG